MPGLRPSSRATSLFDKPRLVQSREPPYAECKAGAQFSLSHRWPEGSLACSLPLITKVYVTKAMKL